MADASAAYALGYSPAELGRLRRQPDELRDDSEVLLDRAGIAVGSSVIDLGCGPQGILDLLADRVGPAGRVTGLDFHPASVAQARTFVTERGYQNVQVVQGDARCTGLPSGSYDLVHARTLLVNAPVRADLLRSTHSQVLAKGIAGERELDEVDRAVREHLDDPGTLVMPGLLFLAWGRKPQAQQP